jgi:regulator of sigma E protease
MSWFWVFVGFCFLIVLHEAGHFVAAKATGMRVERFFLFFGPTLWSFKRGETEYGVKAIPLGGYVKITGMTSEEEVPPEVEHRAYYRQPVWKRIVVTAAGPAVNIVLAFVILFFLAFNYGESDNEIGKVQAGSPAAAASIKPGERLIAVEGDRYARADSEERLGDFGAAIAKHECAGKSHLDGCEAATPVTLTLEGAGGTTREVTVHPTYDGELKRTRVGIEYTQQPAASGAGEAVGFAGDKMWAVTSGTVHVFSHIFESEERKQISGVVGTSDVGHQVVEAGLAPALFLLALVSLSLGLVNLLPILPLDGGHIFWSIVEKLRGGRPVSLAVMERASVIGIVLVAMLFFVGLGNDIGRLGDGGLNVR